MLNRRKLLVGAAVLTPLAYAVASHSSGNSVDKLRWALLDKSQSLRIRIIGDSISWGANASGTRDFISSRTDPNRGTIEDKRAPLEAPSYANLLREWLIETYLVGSERSLVRGGARYENSNRYIHFVNDGISGTSTDDWLPAGSLLDIGEIYDFVICMLGTNDRGKGSFLPHNASRTVRNLHTILDHLERVGTSVILATPNVVSASRDFEGSPDLYAFSQSEVAAAIRKVAHVRRGTGLVDCFRATEPYEPSQILADGLHPSDMGHYILFNEYRKVLTGT